MPGRASMLSSGALVIHSGSVSCLLASTFPCGGPERGSGGWFWVGTLLGPEGTGVLPGSSGYGPGSGLLRMRWPGRGFRPFLENCTVDASISCFCDMKQFACVVHVLCQVFKGTRWMPWHQEPMKDVGACDKPRGVGSQTVIRGFPNGETWRPSWAVAPA